jgi:hypothetical protein
MLIGSVLQVYPFDFKPSAPPVGSFILYVKTDDVIYLQDSSGVEYAFASSTPITSLSGEATASGPGNAVVTLSNSAVIGKVLTGFTLGPNSTILATDTILQAFGKVQTQINDAISAATAITALTGDVSATGPGSVPATVNSVGGSSAVNIHSAELAANAATPSNTSSTIVKRDASGNFSANIITAGLTGNVTGNVSGSSGSFTGSLVGDVTGTQGATVVSTVGGSSAANIHSAELAANAATPSNTSSTIVERDASGNFSANIITANLTGNVSGSSATFTGSLSGDVTGTQSTTTISSSTVTGKVLTGYTIGSNTPIAATDSILSAFEKVQGQLNATTGASITSLTGDVTATGPGAAAATVTAIQGHSVSTTAPTDAQILIWNNSTSKWVPESISGDVIITDLGVASLVATSNSTITTLSALSLPGSQITGNISGNATNVTGIVAIAHGGTGQTTQQTAINALAGAVTSGNFLRGDGTNVTLSPIQASDVPTLNQNTTGTASNITATSNTTLTSLPNLTLPTSQLSGTLQAAQEPAHTGDVTNTAGSLALNLVATTNSTLTTLNSLSLPTSQLSGQVTLSQLPTIANDTILANNSGISATPSALTGAQVNTFLPVFTSTLNGLAPLSGGGTSNYLRADGTWDAPPGATNGTVTSVGLSLPSIFNVTVSPITTSGTLTAVLNTETSNTVFAGPTTGSAATPTFRALVSADIPPINLASTANGGVTGVLNIANGGTDLSSTPTNGQLLIGNGTNYTLGTITAGTGISVTNAAGSITVTNTQTTAYTTKTANYTILSTDGTIFCDTSGGAFTLTLPSPTGLGGKLYRIIDSTGFFQTNNITLAPNGAEKIEGLAASKILQTPWGGFTITTDSINWFVMG